MAHVLTSRPSKKSKLQRIPFLPRIGITVDVAGKQFGYFNVPIVETLVNMKGRKWTISNFIEVAHQQIKELDLPNKPVTKRNKTKSSRAVKS